MKKLITSLSFLFLLINSNAQTPTVEWAKNMGGINGDYGLCLAVDTLGNLYSTGYFNGISDFDPGIGIANLTSVGSNDIYISKLDPGGKFLWAKSVGGTFSDIGVAIVADDSGNVYTTGNFAGTVDFDPGIGVFNLTSSGLDDIFVLKLDVNGKFVWVKNMGGVGYDDGRSIALDGLRNVYTCGTFDGKADFNPGVDTSYLSPTGSTDAFICKLDASGNFVWAVKMGGPLYDIANSIKIDVSGNVLTTGYFQGTVDFDPSPTKTSNLISAGSTDIFVWKLDGAGNLIWAKQMGGGTKDEAMYITTDASGNVYTSGYYNGKADFDPGTGIYNLTPAGFFDAFISKLDAGGNFVWAKSFGGISDDRSVSIAIDASGNIYQTGWFIGTADFDPGSGTSNLISAGGADIYISKLDATGNFLWAQSIGTNTDDYSNSITVSKSGDIYTTGSFSGTVDFDPGVGFMYVSSIGNSDIFVYKINQFRTGINPDQNHNNLYDNFKIYPNPSGGLLNFEMTATTKISSVEVYNNLGVLVYKESEIENSTIDLTKLETGIYFLKITDYNKNSVATRFLKQ